MDQKPKRKAPSSAFKPGQSGNPSGRPKEVAHVKELARSYTAEAIATLAEVMKDASQPASARVKASETLLDRAWGRAEATVNVKQVNDVRDLSTAEILAALASVGVAGAEGSPDQSGAVH